MMIEAPFRRAVQAASATLAVLAAGAMRIFVAVLLLLTATGVSFAQTDPAEPPPYEVLPVPSVTIYPGDIIQDAMLTEQHFLPGTQSRYPVVGAREMLIGKVARRTLLPDRLIPTNSVAEPEIVAHGALTTAIFQSGGLSMTATVVALEGGSLGKLIQVRNVDSGRIVSGVVLADGTVSVGGP